MKVKIIFKSSSAPKVMKKVDAVYTKDGLCCIQYRKRKKIKILKIPLCEVFYLVHKHKKHWGSRWE